MSDRPKLGVVMDPIHSIHPKKDTTLALLLEAQRRGFELHYMEMSDLYLQNGLAFGNCKGLVVRDDLKDWYSLSKPKVMPLEQLNVILMRKDPPVTLEYLYSTYLLERAEIQGVLVINKPQSLRDANEKLFATWFPHCMPPSLVSSNPDILRKFVEEHETVVFKPLDAMGGQNIFKCNTQDPNLTLIMDLLTHSGTQYMMAQKFIPEIRQGDKRILLIDGEAVPYGLARIPPENEFRGNLALGGTGVGVALTERDQWICGQIGQTLRDRGLTFVGIDVIGDYLTEINVTSPTCVRELEREYSVDIAGQIVACIEQKLQAS